MAPVEAALPIAELKEPATASVKPAACSVGARKGANAWPAP